MSDGQKEAWSPARNPYAIAVSQSWWEFQAVLLFAANAKDGGGSAQQISARQILGHLRALRRCAEMQAKELEHLGVDDPVTGSVRITAFDAAVPGATCMRPRRPGALRRVRARRKQAPADRDA